MDHTPIPMDQPLIFTHKFSGRTDSEDSQLNRLQWPPPSKSSLNTRSSQVWPLPPHHKTARTNDPNPLKDKPLSSRFADCLITSKNTPFTSSSNKCVHDFSSQGPPPRSLHPLKSTRTCCLRIFQITASSLSLLLLYILVSSPKGSWSANHAPFVPLKLNFQSWIISPIQNPDDHPENSDKLLDLKKFRFILNNASKCSLSDPEDKIFFVILVHSAPKNYKERQAIRNTWGSVKLIDNLFIRLVFLLGTSPDFSINGESEEFGDIVSGDFVDSYRNLTYKHLMGYKWALHFCPRAKLVLKTDDDAFVDIFQLLSFVRRTFGENPRNSLICNVLPEGTHPVRNGDTGPGSKWAVTQSEYPYSIYPKYCSGLAYLATPDLLRRVLNVSGSVKYMWIDDVFVTGIIRDLARVEPFYLNLRYSYEAEEYRRWVTQGGQNSTPPTRLPFMFAHLERGPYLGDEMRSLWDNVSRL